MQLSAESFRVTLPPRWEGAVRTAVPSEAEDRSARRRGRVVSTPPVLHLTTASLPAVRGDFGSGAVDLLGPDDVFVAVLEYGAESVGTALFDTGPLPRRLAAADFRTDGLQRAIPGQSGVQRFCTERGRALCLYVVLGGHHRARRVLPRVTEALAGIEVVPA